MTSSSPIYIVFNIAAGKGAAEAARAAISAACEAARREFHILVVDDPAKIREIAREAIRVCRQSDGIIVAAGGDGTINAVAQEALGSGCAFGVLPQGTFNYFSRSYRIPSDTTAAMQSILVGTPRPVQVGLVNDQVFLVNASLGLYPKLLENREAWKAQWGRSRLVAFAAGITTLLRGAGNLRLRVDLNGVEREVRTPTLFIGNNALQMTQLGFNEAADIDAGLLAGIMLKPVNRFAMLALLLRGAVGRLGAADDVVNFAFRSLTVQRRTGLVARRVKVATDGEISWQMLPVTFRVSPQRLLLLCPPAPASGGEIQ